MVQSTLKPNCLSIKAFKNHQFTQFRSQRDHMLIENEFISSTDPLGVVCKQRLMLNKLPTTFESLSTLLLLCIIFLATLVGCSNNQVNNQNNNATIGKSATAFPELRIRNAGFPLLLSEIDFQDTTSTDVLNDAIERKLTKTINDIYYNDCRGDSNQTYFSIDDTYIGTIRLRDTLRTIFMVIFQHIPGGLDSKILFYDMQSKEFADNILDFNIQGLYDLDSLQLRPTNLKKELKITSPEIELVDFDKDGVNDFKFTRLFHNGTSNAIETTIIKVSDNKIDTLDFKQKWMEPGNL